MQEDKPISEVAELEQPGKALNLIAALTERVQKAKASRCENADVHKLPKPKKAVTMKKSAAKPTKTTTAEMTSARGRRSM